MFREFAYKINSFLGKSNEKSHDYFFNAFQIGKESKDGDYILIVPIGEFPNHPTRPHSVERNHIDEIARNLRNSGTMILLDYGHASLWNMAAKAAGWSPNDDLKVDEKGLWIKPFTYTKAGKEAVENGDYLYFSPVYRLETVDKKGRSIGATLHSVGLTNKPVMDLEIDHPATLNADINQEADMKFTKEFLNSLGLPETATAEGVEAAVNAKLQAEAESESAESPSGVGGGEGAVNSGLEARLAALEQQRENDVKAAQSAQAESLVNSALASGKITAQQKTAYLAYAEKDFNACKAELEAIKANSVLPGKMNVPSAGDTAPDNPHKKAASFVNAALGLN